MKKAMIVVIVLLSTAVIGNKLFCKYESICEDDFSEYYWAFEKITIQMNEKSQIITKENYDSTSLEYQLIFEKLEYQFISVSKKGIYFCKNYKGMSSFGLLYVSNESYISTKDKIIKRLNDEWVVFSEHYL